MASLFLFVVCCIIYFTRWFVRGVSCSSCQLGVVLTFLFKAGSLTYAVILNELLILRKSEAYGR